MFILLKEMIRGEGGGGGGGKLNVYQNRRECDKLTISRKIIIVTFIVINSKMKFLHKTKMKNPNFHLF